MAVTNADHLEIPVVDFSPLASSQNANVRKHVAQDLRAKASINGVVGIKGHSISQEDLEQAFDMIRRLFDLSYEEKMKAPHPDGPVPHRGYLSMGREHGAKKLAMSTDDEEKKKALLEILDHKETYDIGSEENDAEHNIWLPDSVLPGFRQFMTDLYWEINRLADTTLDMLISSLDLTADETDQIKSIHVGHNNQLRLAHYPPRPAEDGVNGGSGHENNFWRLGPHTDWSSFTFLFQQDLGGLEFQDRQTSGFMPATPTPGLVYMSIGDMFEKFSNGIYPSALHRVVGYPDSCQRNRYSIPYFVSPASDGMIQPAPSLATADSKALGEPFQFGGFSRHLQDTVNTKA